MRRNSMIILVGVLLSCCLPSCLTMQNPSTVEEVVAGTKVESDPFSKVTQVQGPRMTQDLWVSWTLRTFVLEEMGAMDPKVLEVVKELGLDADSALQLYVWYSASDWAFLERTNDIDGESLTTREIDRQVGGGGYITEHIAIDLNREYLQEHAASGIHVRIYGKRKDVEVVVPGYYVQGFLESLEANGIGGEASIGE